jgi:hypothetical protein
MDVETMREAVRLADRIGQLAATHKRLKGTKEVRITPWLYDSGGSAEDLVVPAKKLSSLYAAKLRSLREELRVMTGAS